MDVPPTVFLGLMRQEKTASEMFFGGGVLAVIAVFLLYNLGIALQFIGPKRLRAWQLLVQGVHAASKLLFGMWLALWVVAGLVFLGT